MTPRHWWLGIAAVVLAILLHALPPRYEWRGTPPHVLRIDRWTGTARLLSLDGLRPRTGQFRPDDITPEK